MVRLELKRQSRLRVHEVVLRIQLDVAEAARRRLVRDGLIRLRNDFLLLVEHTDPERAETVNVVRVANLKHIESRLGWRRVNRRALLGLDLQVGAVHEERSVAVEHAEESADSRHAGETGVEFEVGRSGTRGELQHNEGAFGNLNGGAEPYLEVCVLLHSAVARNHLHFGNLRWLLSLPRNGTLLDSIQLLVASATPREGRPKLSLLHRQRIINLLQLDGNRLVFDFTCNDVRYDKFEILTLPQHITLEAGCSVRRCCAVNLVVDKVGTLA